MGSRNWRISCKFSWLLLSRPDRFLTRAGEMAGHGNMRGMMSEEDMAALDAAEGTEASRLYLEQMIRHHEGAVDMARDEVNDGQNPEAVALAEDIIDAQESEIAEMEQLLQNL